MTDRKPPFFSLIVPAYNEQEVLPTTHERLTTIMNTCQKENLINGYEILYVDDGSTDTTITVLRKIFANDKNVRIIELRRNFGLQGALSAGLSCAKGDVAVTIDADLQDPPEKIPEMLKRYMEGFDLVLGVRADRSTDTAFKRISANMYYKLLTCLGVKIVEQHGDFRLMARDLINEYNNLHERNRFMRALILELDNRYAVVTYKREARTLGTTKFNLSKMLSFSIDGVVSFSYAPLRLVSFLGFFMCFLALAGVAWIIGCKIHGITVPGWTSTVLPIFIFSGIQTLILGLVGEYIGRLYIETKHRPLFSIRREEKHT
jgi:glycosyltransferase involved in cell wall biosynthesis